MASTCDEFAALGAQELRDGFHVNHSILSQPSILGGMQVLGAGNLANWMEPGKMIKVVGGAVALVVGVSRMVVVMVHREKDGDSKFLKACTLPMAGKGMGGLLIADLGTQARRFRMALTTPAAD